MKRIILTTLLNVCSLMFVNAQQLTNDTASFMNDYRQLVAFIEFQKTVDQSTIDSISIRNDSLKLCYKYYKPQLSNRQVKEYHQLKAQLSKQLMRLRGSRLGEGIRYTTDTIAQKANRIGNAIGGYIEGILH